MTDSYEDIIHLPHHVSKTRPQMPIADRAAQFSPFAALTGYDAAIEETGRLTDDRIDFGEEVLSELDRKCRLLLSHLDQRPEVHFTYFKPDDRKSGGAYVKTSGIVKKLLEEEAALLLQDGTKISIYDITDMESSIFSEIEL